MSNSSSHIKLYYLEALVLTMMLMLRTSDLLRLLYDASHCNITRICHWTNNQSIMCSAGGGGGGLAAKDQAGNTIKATSYLKTHPVGDYSLCQGLKVCQCCILLRYQAL